MSEWERLPEQIADMPPGPELGNLLATVDRSKLNGYDVVVLMQARARQLAHYQAELYADMAEVAHCPWGNADSPQRQESPEEHADDEIGAALSWTRNAASSQLWLALSLTEGLPQVWGALHEGDIDAQKAKTFVYGTQHLEGDTARQVADSLIQKAAELTTGQLSARLKRLCFEANPDEAADRYQEGLAERRVIVSANEDGTANLSGCQLPPDRANAIANRINRLARTLKTHDDPRRMDQIRADVYLDLLEGNHHRRHRNGRAVRGVVDIHLDLETLTGLADNPGEIPGWGPVIADLARQIAAGQHQTEWRYTLTDGGHVIGNGTTRRRPTAAQRRTVEARHPTCVFPGCRMPARNCDLDHRRPWAQGGETTVRNLNPTCRHHHILKDHGWQLTLNPNRDYIWTSPLGHTYTITSHPP